jgi:hypothetical protein
MEKYSAVTGIVVVFKDTVDLVQTVSEVKRWPTFEQSFLHGGSRSSLNINPGFIKLHFAKF